MLIYLDTSVVDVVVIWVEFTVDLINPLYRGGSSLTPLLSRPLQALLPEGWRIYGYHATYTDDINNTAAKFSEVRVFCKLLIYDYNYIITFFSTDILIDQII